jgi:hypothetical protein
MKKKNPLRRAASDRSTPPTRRKSGSRADICWEFSDVLPLALRPRQQRVCPISSRIAVCDSIRLPCSFANLAGSGCGWAYRPELATRSNIVQ